MSFASYALLTTVLSGSLVCGCSFVSSRPPRAPRDPSDPTTKRCGGVEYPLADTISTFAALTWVLAANGYEQDPSRYYLLTTDDTKSFMRVSGYTAMAIFAASSIYGYVIEAQCARQNRELADHSAFSGRSSSSWQLQNVGGFTFGSAEMDAERTCVAKHYRWELRGVVAFCSPHDASNAAPPFRLEFESGTLHRIVSLHRSSSERIAQDYDELYRALRSTYGGPQREPATRTDTCAHSLSDCLKKGEILAGPAWYWHAGSLELQVVSDNDELILEERYTREESPDE